MHTEPLFFCGFYLVRLSRTVFVNGVASVRYLGMRFKLIGNEVIGFSLAIHLHISRMQDGRYPELVGFFYATTDKLSLLFFASLPALFFAMRGQL